MNDACIVSHLAAHHDLAAARQLRAASRRPASRTLRRDAGQVGALHADVDVDRRQDVVARDDRRSARRCCASTRLPSSCVLPLPAAGAPAPVPTGMLSSASSESTLVLRRLHRDVVDHAVLRIEPERRRRLRAARQRDQHVLADVGAPTGRSAAGACGPSAGSRAGRVQALVHVRVDRAGDLPDRLRQLGGERARWPRRWCR